MKQTTTPAHTEREPTRFERIRWPLIVVGLLSCHVAAMLLAVSIAKGDTVNGMNGAQILPEADGRTIDQISGPRPNRSNERGNNESKGLPR